MTGKTYVFDLDGTLCSEEKTFEKYLAKPNPDMIALVNKLYEQNKIIIYTARGWAEYNITQRWLEDNDVKYHILMCGKPIYDMWIDDKCCSPEEILKES